MLNENEGICLCGCGGKTTICTRNDRLRGLSKGMFHRYIIGHHMRGVHGVDKPNWNGGRKLSKDGYVLILSPDHPRSCKGYIPEHIVVVERVLGKPLPLGAMVHHSNKIRIDNRPSNLVICQDNDYHQLVHQRMRAFKASGHADWRKCSYCKEYSPIDRVILSQHHAYHRDCMNAAYRKKRGAADDARN
jgi:hypothetical protein